MSWSYAQEKFRAARRALMLPHSRGEENSIAEAFHECMLGVMDITPDDVPNPDAANQLRQLLEFMDTEGIPNAEEGKWVVKARSFAVEDKINISNLVDSLAWWFGEFREE